MAQTMNALTVAELIAILQTLPPERLVYHDGCCGGGCTQPVTNVNEMFGDDSIELRHDGREQ